jgi:predicted nucleotidyltransferase
MCAGEKHAASEEVKELARKIADVLAPGHEMTMYVYGSRIRGDNRRDSDVDMHFVLPKLPTSEFVSWWTDFNASDFAALRAVLPGRLEFLERNDPLFKDIENGEVVHRDRNVACIWRKPKD